MSRDRKIKCYANPAIATLFEACPDHEICNRCGCCDRVWEECESCAGEGGHESDDLEDLEWGDDYEQCVNCDGKGGWASCIGRCDKQGIHTSAGREDNDHTKDVPASK